jgi:hypothetical protein
VACLVGQCKLNAVAPSRLKGARFQPLSLSSEKSGFKVWVFTCNLNRYSLEQLYRVFERC